MSSRRVLAADSTSLLPRSASNNTTIGLTLGVSEADSILYARGIKEIVIPSVFIFGILGNTINLLVLGQKKLKRNMEQVEKSATLGLMNLALSDLLFCFVGFPTLILSTHGRGSGTSAIDVFRFHYEIYQRPLLNIFLFSSTWLVTVISGERFVGVCFPYRACTMIKVRRTMLTHSIVFVTAIIINLPLFFKFRIVHVPCYSTYQCYTMEPSWFFFQDTLANVHRIVWLTLGTFIPLVILLFCNASILKSVLQLHHAPASSASNEHQSLTRLTWILLSIVFLFLALVCPSMVLEMVHQTGFRSDMINFTLAVAITNLMQAVKFSSNFLLYCGLHAKFRKILVCRFLGRFSRLNTRNASVEKGVPLAYRDKGYDNGTHAPSQHCSGDPNPMMLV